MRLLKYFMFLVFFVVILVAVIGLLLPSSTQIERSVFIEQKPGLVFQQLNSLKNFHQWSPWSNIDPDMEVSFSGPESGEGARMEWSSEDPNVGSGSQEIVFSKRNERVETALDFGAMGYATGYWQLTPREGGVDVLWGMTTEHGSNLMSRYMGMLMDKWVGQEFEKGLETLKSLAEDLPSLVTEQVTYEVNGQTMKGFLAYPNGVVNQPGVLVIHEWWGQNDYARKRATMLAELGYPAFALDMYGNGKVATHPKDANAFMTEVLNNSDQLTARFNAALDLFKSAEQTDADNIVVIGYCFGGSVALSMGRAGADVAGVVSFHGGLKGLAPLTDLGAETPYLVFNGEDDPMVTEADKKAFIQEMDRRNVQYEFVDYPGALHAFTNPGATEIGEAYGLPLAYNKEADRNSWQRLQAFLKVVFGETP